MTLKNLGTENENISVSFILDRLTEDYVSVKRQIYFAMNNNKYHLGEPHRKSFINSQQGRDLLETSEDIPTKYKQAIFDVWGDAPTIEEAEPEDEIPLDPIPEETL